jgi:hypothetical protein
MKPFIIFKELKDNKVELTAEELKELVSQVYNQGYTDGKKDNNNWIYPTTPNWNEPHVKNPYDVKTIPLVYQTPVTCSTSDDNNCNKIKTETSPTLGCF